MQKVNSQIPFDYVTVKTTRSRINKGLLAIPVSLYDLFPKHSRNIFVVGNDNKEEQRTFTPYSSSSKECRIGGMRAFYERFKIEDGDELVIQVLDDDKFKIFPEKLFQTSVREIERNIEKAGNENEVATEVAPFV